MEQTEVKTRAGICPVVEQSLKIAKLCEICFKTIC
jgi:hypothetical protein